MQTHFARRGHRSGEIRRRNCGSEEQNSLTHWLDGTDADAEHGAPREFRPFANTKYAGALVCVYIGKWGTSQIVGREPSNWPVFAESAAEWRRERTAGFLLGGPLFCAEFDVPGRRVTFELLVLVIPKREIHAATRSLLRVERSPWTWNLVGFEAEFHQWSNCCKKVNNMLDINPPSWISSW